MRAGITVATLFGCAVASEIPSDGIAQMQTTLEEFKADLESEGKKAAVLYEEQACTFKEVFTTLKNSIKENQASYEEAEGDRQVSQARFEFLNGPKVLDGSVKHSKDLLMQEEQTLDDLTKEKKKKMKKALTVMAEAGEAVKLIEGAEAALQAATEKVEAGQSLLQVRSEISKKMPSLSLLMKEQPSAHSTDHGQITGMLHKLKDNILDHLEETRSDWTIEENRLTSLMQASEAEIARLKTKIADDTEEMDNERANVLALDQKLHSLKIQIQSDTKVLKETTERAHDVKTNYDKDEATRVMELATVHKATELLKEKFSQAPEPVSDEDANKDEGGDAKPKSCTLDPVDEPVSIPPVAFFQERSKSVSLLKKLGAPVTTELMDILSHNMIAPNGGKKFTALVSVESAVRRGDPLKKIRIMIKNLIERLKTESANELARHSYCKTEEDKMQASRDQKKSDINKYEAGLESAQSSIAESQAKLASLEEAISDAKKECAAQNGQLTTELKLVESEHTVAKHGMESLNAVIDVLKGEFFSESKEGGVDSKYKGNQDAGASVIGMMEALRDQFQDTVENMTEEKSKLNTAIQKLLLSTSTDVADKRDQMSQEVQMTLSPAIASFKSNGQNLYNTVQEYSLVTEELIVLKYDSEACADKHLTKEEEVANLEAEIKALKDALAVLEAHGAL